MAQRNRRNRGKGRRIPPLYSLDMLAPKDIEKAAKQYAAGIIRPQIKAKKYEIASERGRGREEASLVAARTAGMEQGLAGSQSASEQIANTLRTRLAEFRKGSMERLGQEEEGAISAARKEAESRQQQLLPEQEQQIRTQFAQRRKSAESEADISGVSGEQQAAAGQQAAAQTVAAGKQYTAEAKGGAERRHQKALQGLRSELSGIKATRGQIQQEIGMKLVERERALGASIAEAQAKAAAQMAQMQMDQMRLSELQRHNQALEGISAANIQAGLSKAEIAAWTSADNAQLAAGTSVETAHIAGLYGIAKSQAAAATAAAKATGKAKAEQKKWMNKVNDVRETLRSGKILYNEKGKPRFGYIPGTQKPRTVGDLSPVDFRAWYKSYYGYAPSISIINKAKELNRAQKAKKQKKQGKVGKNIWNKLFKPAVQKTFNQPPPTYKV